MSATGAKGQRLEAKITDRDSGTDALFVVQPSGLHVFVVRPSRLHVQAGRPHHKFANEPRRGIEVRE
jgi:hypothetical protein